MLYTSTIPPRASTPPQVPSIPPAPKKTMDTVVKISLGNQSVIHMRVSEITAVLELNNKESELFLAHYVAVDGNEYGLLLPRMSKSMPDEYKKLGSYLASQILR